jgi:peptidase E
MPQTIYIYIDKKVNDVWWETIIFLPSTGVDQYSDNYDATMRPMRQTLVLIVAEVGVSVLQPATILIYGSVKLCNENNCTCMKYISSLD